MENDDLHPVLSEIEACMAATGIKKTPFGLRVGGDRSLVDDLRKGRDPGRKKVKLIRQVIAEVTDAHQRGLQ